MTDHDPVEELDREFIPADFERLSPREAVYLRAKFSAAAEMKTAIKRLLHDDLHGDEDFLPYHHARTLRRVMEDWLNVPIPPDAGLERLIEGGHE